jgi:tRNA G46 methylase TrmB
VTPEPLIDDGIVVGNVFDKHRSRNPVVRHLMAGFDRGLNELLDRAGAPASVLEVGCGEGHVTAHLAQRFPAARVLGMRLEIEEVRTPAPWTQVLGRPRPAVQS